jgi:hypothetical protein
MTTFEALGRRTPLVGAVYGFRGFSKYAGGPGPDGRFGPKWPLGSTAEMIAVLDPGSPLGHVLGDKREHFTSWALHPSTSRYYATGGGKYDGYMAIVRLPAFSEVASIGGSSPCAFKGVDGTQWLDPRALPASVKHLLHHLEAVNRAVTDDEILLAAGRVRPVRIIPVRKSACPRDFKPWCDWGRRSRGSQLFLRSGL